MGFLSSNGKRPSDADAAAAFGLLPETMFLRTLALERKRVERSGKRLVLMLVDRGGRQATRERGSAWAPIVAAVLTPIRETDIAGWYEDNRVIGVIFPELGTADIRLALTALRARVTAALQAKLSTDELKDVHIAFHCFPDDGDTPNISPPTTATLYPDVVERDEARKLARGFKRVMDIFGSGLAILLLSPAFLGIALAIRLTSPGPILFRQQRIGRHGVPFTFLKFRSMHAVCDTQLHREFVKQFIEGSLTSSPSGQNGRVVYKLTKDPRITGIGRILRRASLDELPQFFNVFRGDMALVGPRPAIAYEIEAYDVWHRRRLLEVKPGITGLWQVSGRSRVSFDDMVRLDLKYAQTWSVWLDLKILLQTPRTVLLGDGAY